MDTIVASVSSILCVAQLDRYEWALASCTLYPPSHTCRKPHCSRTSKGLLLTKAEAQQCVLYTLDQGLIPVYSVQLYCEGRFSPHGLTMRSHYLSLSHHVQYHHSFQVEGDHRTYYDEISGGSDATVLAG
jgi:hypothetical protein